MATPKIKYHQKIKKIFGEEKYVANYEPTGKKGLRDIAELIAHETTANPGEIEAYLEELMAQTKFAVADGSAVNVKGLGSFYLKTKCKFVEKEEEVSAANISGLNVGFRPSPDLRETMKNAKLERYAPSKSSTSKKGGNV